MTELSVSICVEDREDGPRTVMRLVGEADVSTRELGEALGAEAAKKPRQLVVDVSELAFIDSAGLREIVRAHRRLRAAACELVLVGPNGVVARVLQLSGLDQIIPIRAAV